MPVDRRPAPAPALTRRSSIKLAALLGGALLAPSALAGCDAAPDAAELTATDLTAAVRANDGGVPTADLASILTEPEVRTAAYGLAARLVQACSETDRARDPHARTLVSPLSVAYALALAQNGAAGTTLDEIERVTGLETATLNDALGAYASYLASGTLYPDESANADAPAMPLHIADSIWFKDAPELTVNDAYLDVCARELDATAFAAPFDATTVADINTWVSEQTDGMIGDLIDGIDDGARLFLVNALAFEDAWEEPFDEDDVEVGTFTSEDGVQQQMRLMRSHEGSYLASDAFEGFIKPYAGYRYAFVALLPREGTALADAIAALDGTGLAELLDPVWNAEVEAGLPKFKLEYEAELVEALRVLGMDAAFDPRSADFTPMGSDADGPLFISKVLHKTFIDVSEEGTRAAAATSVEMEARASVIQEEPVVHEVVLDRPFAFLVIDYQVGLPVFIGTVPEL